MIGLCYWIARHIAAAVYRAEGLNLVLRMMPTRFIAPTLCRYGAAVGDDVRFKPPVTVHNAAERKPFYRNLAVGSHCFLGRQLFLDLQARVVIEDRVTLSHQVTLLTHTDVGHSPLQHHGFAPSQAPVVIREGAYLGAGVMVLPGVEIGTCAVVGARAVVTRDVPAWTVVAGVPARPLRSVSREGGGLFGEVDEGW